MIAVVHVYLKANSLYAFLPFVFWSQKQSSQLSRILCMTHALTHIAINLTQYSLTIKFPPLIHTGLCDVYFSLVINSVREISGQRNAYVSTSSVDSTGDVDVSSCGGVADQAVRYVEVYNNNLPRA